MRAEVKEENSMDYPNLKVWDNGLIVLLHKPNTGTVIRSGGDHSIGDYSDNWNEDAAVPFRGEIVLSN